MQQVKKIIFGPDPAEDRPATLRTKIQHFTASL